jgi:type IV secretory pathway TraG/TraD family ATPase VirD4
VYLSSTLIRSPQDARRSVLGQNGWGAIWGAAATSVFGGGMDEQFLKGLSNLIGERDEVQHGGSSGNNGQYSETTSTRRVPILSTDDLANLPKWRVVMFNSDARPVILKSLPWFKDRALQRLIEQDDTAPAVAAAREPVVADAHG